MINLKYDMHILKKEDLDFPWRLKVLEDCPDIIYVLGNSKILNDFSIAVVGSRDCDEYGINITKKFAKELSQRDVCVVSGLAEGVDAYAHSATLDSHGKTIAVIGNGFQDIYPPSNNKLVDRIIENGGTIITEYLPDQAPLSVCFPKRNRIVACMTEGTLVTEAREKSGALITANIAKMHNKKLFAIPGELGNKRCEGSNLLFRDKAKIVLDVNDILSEFPNYKYTIRKEEKQNDIKKNPPIQYKNTYELLNEQPIHINELCKCSNQAPQQVMADLTMLEMLEYIKSLPGGFYQIV